jgi:hypothetical protein
MLNPWGNKAMGNLGKLTALGGFALMGTSVWTLPAAAATLAFNFNPSTNYTAEVVSSASPGEQVVAYGYEFTVSSTVTVTALGTFDNGSINNIGNDNVQNGGNPLVKTGSPDHAGDTVSLYSGTIGGNASLNGLTPLASLVIGGTNASGTATQAGGFAFVNLATSLNLAPGNYFILTDYSLVNFDPVAAFPGTVIDNDAISLTLGVAENCGAPNNCNLQTSADPGIFGPDFEITATPIPAALPLFAGGLGFVGWLARRRKREGSPALAA